MFSILKILRNISILLAAIIPWACPDRELNQQHHKDSYWNFCHLVEPKRFYFSA